MRIMAARERGERTAARRKWHCLCDDPVEYSSLLFWLAYSGCA